MVREGGAGGPGPAPAAAHPPRRGSAPRTSCLIDPRDCPSAKPLPGLNLNEKNPKQTKPPNKQTRSNKVLARVLLPRRFLPGNAGKVTLNANGMEDSWGGNLGPA